jgi:ATP-dependent protease ClpP protease subunit
MVRRRSPSQRSELVNDVYTAGINIDAREIFLHSYIDSTDEYDEIDFRSASTFIQNLRILTLDKDEPILVHMITPGGDWNYGMAIYDAIDSCPCRIIALVYSHAFSMASIILQAADVRIMMPNADFMIHEGAGKVENTCKGIISYAKKVNKENATMLSIYASVCKDGKAFAGKTENEIKTFLQNKIDAKQEWYLNASEAVKYGFADAILGDEDYKTIEKIKVM